MCVSIQEVTPHTLHTTPHYTLLGCAVLSSPQLEVSLLLSADLLVNICSRVKPWHSGPYTEEIHDIIGVIKCRSRAELTTGKTSRDRDRQAHLKETVSSSCTWIQPTRPSYPAVSPLTRCAVYQSHFCLTLVSGVKRRGRSHGSRTGPVSSHLIHCSYFASEFEDSAVTPSLRPTVRQGYMH